MSKHPFGVTIASMGTYDRINDILDGGFVSFVVMTSEVLQIPSLVVEQSIPDDYDILRSLISLVGLPRLTLAIDLFIILMNSMDRSMYICEKSFKLF